VEVQPAPGVAPNRSRKRGLTESTLSELRNLAEGLGDSALKSALSRMVERHGKKR